MKRRKFPYIHILPRILIGVLVCGALLTLLYMPLVSRNILKVGNLADGASPLPTGTPVPSAAASPTPQATPVPTIAATDQPTQEPSDVVVLSAYTTLRLGDDNASVITLHQRLTDLGYLDSDMPGSEYNDSIEGAVVLFQRACDMKQTGIADSETQASLYAENAQTYRIKRLDSGTDVLRLQQRLEELGYYTKRINGYFGPNTEQAVMQFQAINDLNVSGELDYTAWSLLYSDEAMPLPTLATPEPTARRTSSGQGTAATATARAETKTTPKPTVTKAPSSGGRKTYDSVVAAAKDQVGKPYQWSAEGPDAFDCSGLLYYCMKQSGYRVSRHNAKGYSQSSGWKLISSMNDLKAGDLVFFKSDSNSNVNHCGICISSSTMIHASSSKGKVATSRLHQSYWERNFVCGRRP